VGVGDGVKVAVGEGVIVGVAVGGSGVSVAEGGAVGRAGVKVTEGSRVAVAAGVGLLHALNSKALLTNNPMKRAKGHRRFIRVSMIKGAE
jgi:hypothetical protein